MKRSIYIFTLLSILLLLPAATAFGRSRVVVRKDMDLEKVFANGNTKYVIKTEIDLGGKNIKVGEGSILHFRGGKLSNGTVTLNNNSTVRNGYFYDVSFGISSNTTFKKCHFENKNINTCIISNSIEPKKNITVKECSFKNIGNSIQNQSSVHCIYLNSVSDVLVDNCIFENIGNYYTPKVSGVSINTINQKDGNGLTLKNISITDNVFNGIISKNNQNGDSHNTGEFHFIIVSSSENVMISDNTCHNNYESIGYGKEPIYLKCDKSTVINNHIQGNYAGEAVICIKGFTKENVSLSPNVDVINNYINGTFFSAVYHTGSGAIRGNTIINTQAYALACENNLSENKHTIVIENNIIELGKVVPEVSTGTSRAAITLLSYEKKPIKTILKGNSIQAQSPIEVIRCRFAYDVDLELDSNEINSTGKVVSFANLSGYEKSFKLKTRKGKHLNENTIVQPKASNFKVFDVTTE